MKKIILLMMLLPSLASAYTLEVVQGITVYTINGKKVASQFSDNYQISPGINQIAVRFNGKLSNKGKSEHFTSKPYLLTFNAQSDLEITTLSKKYNKIVPLAEQGKPIFKADESAISIKQMLLPAISKTLPYSNIAALVSHYNDTNGIYFDESGLEKLSVTDLKEQQQAKQSMVLSQLKYWYSKATANEIAAFEKWKEEN